MSPAVATNGIAKPRAKSAVPRFLHNPPRLFLLWLAISLPLVTWDFSYVLLRPHSMPGGRFHTPWIPYALYAQVDLVYGRKHYDDGEGFNPAQSTLNVAETALYLYYLYLVGFGSTGGVGGRKGAVALVCGFAASVMTFWKTALYVLIEVVGNYKNTGHNSPATMFWLWIVPNSPWLIFPAYMISVLGRELVAALAGEGL
ncbi:hypothetical protein Dda_8881 [Drechslerella dactyloides]|uniref:EXPERA domain-containing protein n=1 Tax=Drechslerella dactyloides TaxID=74499 RepID=A0AAD6ISY1_DREDA|nr:hypothetical protein Dda_8881 [Drechslerella dactyloides]